MNAEVIVIEGVDGTGKSTLAQSLAKTFGGQYLKSPIGVSSVERSVYDQPQITPQERFDYYLQASKNDILHVQELSRQGVLVILDRSISSTLIHHLAMDAQINIRDARFVDEKFERTQILLHAPPEILLKRIQNRKNHTGFEEDLNLVKITQDKFLQEPSNTFRIDTWSLNVDATLEAAKQHLSMILHLSQPEYEDWIWGEISFN